VNQVAKDRGRKRSVKRINKRLEDMVDPKRLFLTLL
jgi:hypothetical protein